MWKAVVGVGRRATEVGAWRAGGVLRVRNEVVTPPPPQALVVVGGATRAGTTRWLSTSTPTPPPPPPPSNPNAAPTPSGDKLKDRLLDKLAWMMGYNSRSSTRIRNAQGLLRSCVQRAGMPTWAREAKLDTSKFLPKHELLLVHVWVLNRRMLAGGPEGKLLQKEVFDLLWENTERRIRAAGVNEMSVQKQLREVQKVSFGALVSYDVGLKNVEDKDLELASAVWRNLYGHDKDIPDELVMRVAKWMRAEVGRLSTVPLQTLEEGSIGWTLPIGFRVTEEDVRREELSGDRGEWRSAMSVGGKTYWWNIHTRESRWERPAVGGGGGAAGSGALGSGSGGGGSGGSGPRAK